MKKLFSILTAVVAVFSLSSCNKEQIAEVNDAASDIKLNITVANLDGSVDTKAVKTSWEAGDKINIWYEGNAQRDPDLVIKFDGSKWAKDAAAVVSGNVPAASGNIYYVYEGGNDLSKYTGDSKFYYGFNLIYGDNYWRPTTYTYSDGTLCANIEKWLPLTEFQVVVTDIDPAKYELKCSNLLKMSGFSVSGSSISTSNNAYNAYVPGVANKDGAAFYFRTAEDRTATASYVFTLKNTETNEEKTYTVTGKTHEQRTLTAIKIDVSKFQSTLPSYVLDGDAEVYAFAQAKVSEKEVVYDLTVKNCQIYPIRELKNRVKKVAGTFTIDNLQAGGEVYMAMFQFDEGFNSITVQNCTVTMNPAFFNEIPSKKVDGNVIIDNCPKMLMNRTDGSSLGSLTEIGGNLIVNGCDHVNGNTFAKITKVGGDFVLTNCTKSWDLREKTIPLTEIGGNLVVKGNPEFDSTIGFDKLTKIGGNVTFFGPYIPNTNQEDPNVKGFIIFKDYLTSGVIKSSATVTIGRNEASPIDVTTL